MSRSDRTTYPTLAEAIAEGGAYSPMAISQRMERAIDGQKRSALDTQQGGDHYRKLGVYQPWMVAAKWMTPEEMKGAMKLTVMGYLQREASKGGRLDIQKAMHTMQIYLELTGDSAGD